MRVLVLALDTSTPVITTAVVAVPAVSEALAAVAAGEQPPLTRLLAERTVTDAFGHAERLMPLARDALAEAGRELADLDAIVVGLGPGPFTGLRVGIATAAALGDALGRPVHGVPSHDGIAAAAGLDRAFLVVTDARRREVYVSGYRPGGRRVFGPAVLSPAAVGEAVADLAPAAMVGPGTPLLAPHLAVARQESTGSVGEGLVGTALTALLTGAVPGPLTPLYLRRPDATEPKPR